MKDLYRGTLVRLSVLEADVLAKSSAKWKQDSEAQRMGTLNPIQLISEKRLKENFDKREDGENTHRFGIRTLAENDFIGTCSCWVDSWNHGEGWVGIFIGEREYWGKGYGTDAMRLLIRYGFDELNLRRLSLGLHSFNERALKSYLKLGFVVEGRERGAFLRDGIRYDGILMGLLREEWLATFHAG